jgi:hypothetical protein
MSKTAAQTKPAAEAKTEVASPAVRPRRYPEAAVINVLPKGEKNPKRGASAKRFALYKTGMTVGAYLDGCALLHPDEPRGRWLADLTWDSAREFISVAAPAVADKK